MLSPIESDNSSSLFERISLLEDMKMEWEQRCIYESLVMDMHPLVAVTEVCLYKHVTLITWAIQSYTCTMHVINTVKPPLSRLPRCGHFLQPGSYIWNFDLSIIHNDMWAWFNVHTEHVHGAAFTMASKKKRMETNNKIIIFFCNTYGSKPFILRYGQIRVTGTP